MPRPVNLEFNDYEFRISTARADLQPEYQGFAQAESATTANVWTIYKFTYAAGGDITRRQIVFKRAWDDRTTAFP